MIIGIGVDTVDIARFTGKLSATPGLRERLFTSAERALPTQSLAARFAAKEALIKALGGDEGLQWHMIEILRVPAAAPTFSRTEGLCAVLHARGADFPHLSLTHDGGLATAFVVIERRIASTTAEPTS